MWTSVGVVVSEAGVVYIVEPAVPLGPGFLTDEGLKYKQLFLPGAQVRSG